MDEVRTIEVTEEGEFSGGKTASLSTTTAVLLVVGTAVFVIGVLALGTLDSFNQSW